MPALIETEELHRHEAAAPSTRPVPEVTPSATRADATGRSPWTSFDSVRVLAIGVVAIVLAAGAVTSRQGAGPDDRVTMSGVSAAGVTVALELEPSAGRGSLDVRGSTSACSGPLLLEEVRGAAFVFSYDGKPGCRDALVMLRESGTGLEFRLSSFAGRPVRTVLEPPRGTRRRLLNDLASSERASAR